MEQLYFSYSSTVSRTEKPACYVQNKCRKILGDGKKAAEWLGSSGPEECVPFFASCIPNTELTKPTTQNHKWIQTKRAPNKILLSGQRTTKEAAQQDRDFQKITFYHSQMLQKKLWPHLESHRQRPRLPPLPGCNEIPQLLSWGGVREGLNRDLGPSSPLAVNEVPSPALSGKTTQETIMRYS